MMWRTHLVGGMSTLWVFVLLTGWAEAHMAGQLAIAAGFASLLPDLDAGKSKIRSLGIGGIYPFNSIGKVANEWLGHRGFLHSPIALLYVAVLSTFLALWTGLPIGAAVWLGYASHLALDACTKSGIPGGKGRVFLMPPQLRIVTGSQEEEIYFATLGALTLGLLVLSLHD